MESQSGSCYSNVPLPRLCWKWHSVTQKSLLVLSATTDLFLKAVSMNSMGISHKWKISILDMCQQIGGFKGLQLLVVLKFC